MNQRSRVTGQRPSRVYGSGRTCLSPDCDTQLSIYNPETLCNLHRLRKRPRLRGKSGEEVKQQLSPKYCRKCRDFMRKLSRDRTVISGDARSLMPLLIDGETHYTGVQGAATLCEGWVEPSLS